MLALSLFSGAGIGDVGLRAAGFEMIAFSELEGDRLELVKHNFPAAQFFVGDIWETQSQIIEYAKETCDERGEGLKLISCTAPCQGMSKNGQGTLLKNIREGKRPKLDPRNRLIIPALNVIKSLRPEFVVFENVLEMRRTYIEDDSSNVISILDFIRRELGSEYVGDAYDVEFANYGVPQRRQRLISVFSRSPNHRKLFGNGGSLIPGPTHAKLPSGTLLPWVSLKQSLRDFPPLDASSVTQASSKDIPYHRVPLLDRRKYEWVKNTPAGRSAFDNQCVKCGYQENPVHGNSRDASGINQASKITPVHCVRCGRELPRPSVIGADGALRIMSGFTSAYKRMSLDLPAPTLTRNFSYACSDQKIHPSEHRVLSIAEALKLHTLSGFNYSWVRTTTSGLKPATDGLIRLVIGESIPPAFMEILGKFLVASDCAAFAKNSGKAQLSFPEMLEV